MSKSVDVDRTLRRNETRIVRRLPTAEMGGAQFHLGAVSWANPWETTGDGALFRWIVVRHDILRERSTFAEGSERTDRPEPRIVREVIRLMEDDGPRSWVGVSANRLALFWQLNSEQVPVTCGGEHNQALTVAIQLMQDRVRAAMRSSKAKQNLQAPTSAPSRPRVQEPRRRIWEPNVWRVARSESHVVIACDGSFDLEGRHGAFAAVSSNGGVSAATMRASCAGDVELMALVAGLELGLASGAASFALVSDSLMAIDLLEELSDEGCQSRQPVMDRLRNAQQHLCADVAVHHVRARTGNKLHSAADALAFAIRRASTLTEDVSKQPLARLIDEISTAVEGRSGTHIPSRGMKRLVVSALRAGVRGAQ